MAVILFCTIKRLSVTAVQILWFMVISVMPYRSDSMDHVFRLECKSGCDYSTACRAVTDPVACSLKLSRSRSTEYGSAYTAAHGKTAVRSIHDAIRIEISYSYQSNTYTAHFSTPVIHLLLYNICLSSFTRVPDSKFVHYLYFVIWFFELIPD
jgi:hypothetical protein